jgi:NADPH:quinone reductase-like Zn-dependent oxidoreductase
MRAAVLREYGAGGSTLKVENDYPAPVAGPGHVLVRVKTSSVNPIDVRMSAGYGRARLAALGKSLPLVFGRDVAGTVEALGAGVDRFGVGDEVWGMIVSREPGALAEFAVVPAELLVKKPASVGWREAATLPYVALTTWTALVKDGGIKPDACQGSLALVLGGAGGTGSFAIQLLKLWGAKVVATCSARNADFVKQLGADIVIDYARQDFARELRDVDLVYDTVGNEEDKAIGVLRTGTGAAYVTIVHPTLPVTDEMGWEAGSKHVHAMKDAKAAEQKQKFGRLYNWSMIKPDTPSLDTVTRLFAAGKIRMHIEHVYPLAEISEAFARSASNRVRGKLVVEI